MWIAMRHMMLVSDRRSTSMKACSRWMLLMATIASDSFSFRLPGSSRNAATSREVPASPSSRATKLS